MNDARSWYSVSITAAPEASEAVEHAFNSLDALGTEINHLQKKNTDSVTVVGYFDEMPDEEHVQDELLYALRIYGHSDEAIVNTERQQVENADWLAEWKKHWKPSDVGRFVIAPPWSEVLEDEKIVIRIEPNMAFGTGTHPTTQLCLRAIEKYYNTGDSFLDVGTGTGILAIAAAKLNLRSQISSFKCLAVDTDVDSVAIAADNARLNGVGGMIEVGVASITDDMAEFDFVCANLTLDVILPLLSLLVSKTRKTLVLSGVLVEQTDELKDALSASGVSDFEISQSGEWISCVCSVT